MILFEGSGSIKDFLRQFVILLVIGQIFLVGAAFQQTPVFLSDEPEPDVPITYLMQPVANESKTSIFTQNASKSVTLPARPVVTPGSQSAGNQEVRIVGISQQNGLPYRLLAFDFSGPVVLQKVNFDGKLARVRLAPAFAPLSPEVTRRIEAAFRKFAFYRASTYVEFLFFGKGPLAEPSLATSPEGLTRLVVPFKEEGPVFPLSNGIEQTRGLTYYTDRPTTKEGPSDVFLLRMDPTEPGLRLFPVLANEGICQREPLSAMGARYNALAGINAAYFTPPRGDPIGTLIIGRRLISSPLYNRSVFGLDDRGNPLFGNPDFNGTFTCNSITVPIDSVNGKRDIDNLVIFTPEFARSTLTTGDGIELVLIRGRVAAIHSADSLIPPDGIVVSASGERARSLSQVRLGDLVNLDYHVSGAWDRVSHAVCGGPRLLSEGRIDINGMTEKFDPSIIFGRYPRSAVALTWSGDLLFVVVDGRSKQSAGMTLKELASYLKFLGGRQAINLDGGGSSSLLLNGKIMNRPSDGKERPISNGLLITKR
ncbi:MAG: phosphodiester glycosidase family protein [Candidatus Riflebacteria bacterium]|nr:phosphodiester glycosidase family protein [Candidatus Riflebacteria bacterium]